MGYITLILSFFQTALGKWVAGGLIVVSAYLAGDVRGRRIEHAKCEERARAAAVAAVEQDRSAQRGVDANNASTLEDLNKQKEVSDARVRELEKAMADGIVQCVYGDDGKPAAGGMREQPRKGAGNAPAARPARVPAPRSRPAGDKG